jgi:hypothetical protein
MRGPHLGFACVLALVAGCTHDLKALRSKYDTGGVRDSGAQSHLGDGGGSGPDAGTAGGGGSSGTGGKGALSPSACEPCADLPDAGAGVQLRTCCRGTGNKECGLTFGQGNLCLPRMSPGQMNSVCPAVHQAGMMLDGCCKPDARCGLDATGLGLGCVAREEILLQLGAAKADAVACQYDCATDADCASAPGGFVCTEDPADATHKHRICVNDCQRDQDCIKGHVCALGRDVAMDRMIAFCQPPVGKAQPGAYCSGAQDCVNAVCLTLAGMPGFCTELCANDPDCPAERANCFVSTIQTPSKTGKQMFRICGPP